MIEFSTSMMVADPFSLASTISTIDTHTHMYHIDIMDGHYVPNIAQSLDFIKHLKPVSTQPIEVHLMVENAEKYIEPLIQLGVHTIVFHPETLKDVRAAIDQCQAHEVRVGLALNPDQSFTDLMPYLMRIDVVTIMMVYPGFAGQAMVEIALKNIQQASAYKRSHRATYTLEIDGSNNYQTFEKYVQAGAERLILGTGLFNYENLATGYQEIKAFVKDLME